jgi:hypothetical protein
MNELEEDERGKEMEGEEDVADGNGESGPLDGKFAKKVVNELYERYNTLVRAVFRSNTQLDRISHCTRTYLNLS